MVYTLSVVNPYFLTNSVESSNVEIEAESVSIFFETIPAKVCFSLTF